MTFRCTQRLLVAGGRGVSGWPPATGPPDEANEAFRRPSKPGGENDEKGNRR